MSDLLKQNSDLLIKELRQLINDARNRVATTVNAELTMLYWHVGSRLRTEVLQNERAEYGEQIVATVSQQLTTEFGNGFGKRNLFRMIKFAELFSDFEIVTTLSLQLSWSHFVEILLVKNDLAEIFTRKCVGLSVGVFAHYARGLIRCCEQQFHASPKKLLNKNLPPYTMSKNLHLI